MSTVIGRPLHHLTPIRVAGADARAFLQGQLSNDVVGLDTGHCQLASLNSAQGRVQAVVTLIPEGDGLLMVLPASMATATLQRLRKYVLRSKVTFTEAQAGLVARAATAATLAAAGLPCPAQPGQCASQGTVTIVQWHGPDAQGAPRFLVVGPAAELPVAAEADPADADWRLADIRAGLPQVLPETHESFVAQMLNLDLVGGISFTKGCYTGQEIIARTHYKGSVKRRLRRLAGAGSACPAVGSELRARDGGRAVGSVVESAMDGESRFELLAVLADEALDGANCLATTARGETLDLLPLAYTVD